jgi:hypothetical protein
VRFPFSSSRFAVRHAASDAVDNMPKTLGALFHRHFVNGTSDTVDIAQLHCGVHPVQIKH